MTPQVVESLRMFAGGLQQLPQMGQPVEMPAAERVARAKAAMKAELTGKMAVELESCIKCGMCADACHFRVATGDPKYTPIRKLDPLKRLYRREMGPFGWLFRLGTGDLRADELEQWQELVYDSCTECARCSMICPMGIDIPAMVAVMRKGLFAAGLAPVELNLLQGEQDGRNTIFGVGVDHLRQLAAGFEKQGIPVPLDKPKADVLVVSTVIDLFAFHDTLAGMARILNHLQLDWTFSTEAHEGANFGMLTGNEGGQRRATRRIIDTAIRIGAKTVILPECGHAYPALRWEGADIHGTPLPFEVLAPSEFIGREVMAGRLKLEKTENGRPIVYHDPCKHNRTGGVHAEPRAALQAMGFEVREMRNSGRDNYCCGGGAGVMTLSRAKPLRQKVFRLKRDQVDETGAGTLVTACGSCRVQFGINAIETQWTVDLIGLSALVADHLAGALKKQETSHG